MAHPPKLPTVSDDARARKSGAEKLKAARLRKGLTQEQVADRHRVDVRTVRRWENAEGPLGALELLEELEAA